MPFGVAFVSNLGSSSDTSYNSTMRTSPGIIGENDNDSYWIDNGGMNWTQWYIDQGLATLPSNVDCIYVVDGECDGFEPNPGGAINTFDFNTYYGYDFHLPTTSNNIAQSHRTGSYGNGYSSNSGNSIFSWHFGSKYWENIEDGQTIDGLRMYAVDSQTYSCNYGGFSNITFEGKLVFNYQGSTRTYSGFDFDKNTKYEYSLYSYTQGSYGYVCSLGFVLDFDLTGFESMELYQFNYGDWDNTTVSVYLEDFSRNDGLDFADTQLPFAGDGQWRVGFEYKAVDPQETGFLIKTGTLILAVITIFVAIASTPYYDPFRNFFKGAID